ncbi:MAG TPA: MFS transporter [Rhodopila sp.]|nr:MFS transporter [Rhodopila sp.]
MRTAPIGLAVFTTSLAFVLVQLDVSIINVALATIETRLHTGLLGLQWVVDGYALAFASLLLSAGALSDRVGARLVFLLGLALFTGASVLCGMAPDAGMLIAARVLQGAGAAALVPASLALLDKACGDDPALRAWGVGMWTAAGSVGLAAGPLLGGIIVDLLGWRGIFLINLPIGGVGLWLAERGLSTEGTDAAGTGRRIDAGGLVLAVVVLLSLTACTIQGHSLGWSSPIIRAGVAVSALAIAALIAVERRHPHPMLPLALFRSRTFSGTIAVGFLLNLTLYGCVFVLGLYFQQARHWPAWRAGIAFLPLPVVLGIANMLAKRIGAALGAAATMSLGLLIAASGGAILAGLGPATPYAVILLGLVVLPSGIGITVPVMTATLLGSVPRARAGVAAGVLNAVRQAGGAIGVALLGGLSIHGAGGVFLLAAALLVLAAGMAAWLVRPNESRQGAEGAAAKAALPGR